jgi:transcriptional regulator with XRE-family HTH domain
MNSEEVKGFAHRLYNSASKVGIRRPVDLARMAGLNPITVSAYMRGTRKASLNACYAMAEVINVNPIWLYCGHDNLTAAKTAAPHKPNHKNLMLAAEHAHDLGMTLLQLSSKLTMMSNNI